MNAIGFWAAMMTIKGFELNVGREGRMFIIFFLTSLPLVKYFLIHSLGLWARLGFYIREISSRGTTYRFSFYQQQDFI
jgi:hypothetical protein